MELFRQRLINIRPFQSCHTRTLDAARQTGQCGEQGGAVQSQPSNGEVFEFFTIASDARIYVAMPGLLPIILVNCVMNCMIYILPHY